MAARTSQSGAKLAAQLQRLHAGNRILPSQITSLRLQYHERKGNAGLRHWIKDDLPSLLHANPALRVDVVPKKTVKSKGKEAAPAPTSSSDTWKEPAGIFIGLDNATKPEVFLPFPARQGNEVFWKIVQDPSALEVLGLGPVEAPVTEESSAPPPPVLDLGKAL